MKALEPGYGDQPVVETVADAGPVRVGPSWRPVSAGVDWARRDLSSLRGVAHRARPKAVQLARTGRRVGRAAGRNVTAEAFDGIPTVDGVAQRGANAIARAAARLLNPSGWFNAGGWSRLGKYRTRWDP